MCTKASKHWATFLANFWVQNTFYMDNTLMFKDYFCISNEDIKNL